MARFNPQFETLEAKQIDEFRILLCVHLSLKFTLLVGSKHQKQDKLPPLETSHSLV